MHVKLACAVSVAAGVAIPTDCRNKSDDGAGTAAWIKAPASHARVAKTGRAARSTGRIAYSDNENGVRLANEERSMQYPANDGRPGRRSANTEGILGFVEMGTRVAYLCADDPSAAVDGHSDSGMSGSASDLDADIVQIPPFPAYFFDEAKPHAGARRAAVRRRSTTARRP
jgi:branched-chain amino acid transport system substrate-binding protein